jgi:hypothetical protein
MARAGFSQQQELHSFTEKGNKMTKEYIGGRGKGRGKEWRRGEWRKARKKSEFIARG